MASKVINIADRRKTKKKLTLTQILAQKEIEKQLREAESTERICNILSQMEKIILEME